MIFNGKYSNRMFQLRKIFLSIGCFVGHKVDGDSFR